MTTEQELAASIVNETLKNEMQSIVDQIKQNIISTGKQATGKTAASLKLKTEKNGGIFSVSFEADKHFPTLEKGRRPTPDKKPSREMIENISDWVDARGLDDGAVWPIAMTINNEGTKLWREGGRTDIYSPYFQPAYLKGVKERISNAAGRGFAGTLKRSFK